MALRFGMNHSPYYSQLRIISDTLLVQSQKFIAKDLKDLCTSETRNLGRREINRSIIRRLRLWTMPNEYAKLFRFPKCSLWHSDVSLIIQFESLSKTTSEQISNSALEEEKRKEAQPAVCRSCGSFSVLLGRGGDNIKSPADSIPTLGPLIHNTGRVWVLYAVKWMLEIVVYYSQRGYCDDDKESLPDSSRFQKEMNFPYQEEFPHAAKEQRLFLMWAWHVLLKS